MVIDKKVTQAVQDWLNTPVEQRDLRTGADLMLSLNRNRALYNSVLSRPAKFMDKMVYELRKYLRIRLDNMAVADVIRMEERVMPAAKEIVTKLAVISADDEIGEGVIARGKRADHDSLPQDIRALWDRNITLSRQIVLLFNELKAMADCQPCDRYEKLVILDKADKEYRANFARYDNFKLDESALMNDHTPQIEPILDPEKARANARKNLSKYIKKLESEDTPSDDIINKIRSLIKTIYATGGSVQRGTADILAKYGVIIDPDDGHLIVT